MRHWTSQSDYTAISYEGVLPRMVNVTPTGIEVLPAKLVGQAQFPKIKEAGGMVPASAVAEELQKTAQNYQRDFLPTWAVLGIINNTVTYNLRTRFDSVPADVKEWSDPPHVELVNCTFDNPEDLKRFIEMYGFGLNMVRDPALTFEPPKSITISVQRLRHDQAFLRESWGKTQHSQPIKDSFLWSPNDVSFAKGKARIKVTDIWDYIVVLFLIDLSAGRLRVCANTRCKTLKYFVQERRNQKFCSVRCKNSFHVNSWLALPENRKRWNTARRKARPGAKVVQRRKS